MQFHQTALGRQIAEAVRIYKWGEDIILNSKAEFNRCRIGRLTIGEDNKKGEEIDNLVENNLVERE